MNGSDLSRREVKIADLDLYDLSGLELGGQQFDRAIAEGLRVPIEDVHSIRVGLLAAGDNPADITQIHHHLTEPVDALAAELSKCIRYYESVFRGRPVERAIFLGGQAYDKELCQALARRLNLPAQIGDPLLRIKRSSGTDPEAGMDHREPQPDWAVAVGLSVGAETAA